MAIEAGQQLLHYRLIERIGKGGMGEVYVARDSKLNRNVALKVLPQEVAADADRRARFAREAQAVAALNHPNIVTIFSVEEDDGVHFITMERVEGKTLTELLPRGGFALNKLLEIAIPLADAVSNAHRAGITHRDLKPDNVMIDAEGRLRVLDFGLAKLSESSQGDSAVSQLPTKTAATEEGKILGTVAYMSPEQAEGKAVDARTDVFSLGTMLYELATGQRPFQGETSMSTISSILKDTPQSITELNASLPRQLGRIVRRCLAKEPDRRYQTTLDLRNELEALSQEVASGELVSGAQSAPVIGRSSRTWAVLAIAAAVLIAGTLLIVRLTGGLSSQPTAEVRQGWKRLMTQGEPFSVAISPDGHYVAHSNRGENQWTLSVTQVSTNSPMKLLATKDGVFIEDVSFGPDGQFVYYRIGDTLFRIPFLGGHPTRVLDQVKEVGLSPDGSRVAITTMDIPAHLFVSNLDGTDRRRISSEAYFFLGYPTWSPDGTRVAFVTDSPDGIVDLREVSTVGGEETLLGDPWANFSGLVWAPDGKRLILAGTDDWWASPQALWEVSYPAGRATRITTDLGSYRNPSLSADGTTLASVRSVSHSTVWVVSTDRTQPPQRILFRSGQSDHFGVSWMADGRILYGSDASGNADCWIMNAEGSGARRLTSDPGADHSPVATPDGESIVFVSNRSGAPNLWTMKLDGSSAQQLTRGRYDTQPDVSPDGRWVVYNCGRFPAAVCRIPIDGGDAEKLSRDLDDLHGAGPAISPDGTRIAYHTPDNGTEIISIDGGDVLGQQPTYTAQDWNVDRWTLDGKNLTHVYWNDGVPNISTIPVGGGEDDAVQRTFLDQRDAIYSFAWSPDGTQVVLATGGETAEIVLLEDF